MEGHLRAADPLRKCRSTPRGESIWARGSVRMAPYAQEPLRSEDGLSKQRASRYLRLIFAYLSPAPSTFRCTLSWAMSSISLKRKKKNNLPRGSIELLYVLFSACRTEVRTPLQALRGRGGLGIVPRNLYATGRRGKH